MIRPGQLVIIDEASLAGTLALDAITAQAADAGAKSCSSATGHNSAPSRPAARSPCSSTTAADAPELNTGPPLHQRLGTRRQRRNCAPATPPRIDSLRRARPDPLRRPRRHARRPLPRLARRHRPRPDLADDRRRPRHRHRPQPPRPRRPHRSPATSMACASPIADGAAPAVGDHIVTRRQRPPPAHRHRLGQERRHLDRHATRPRRIAHVHTRQARNASPCPPTTSANTSNSATPPPHTAPKAAPSTPPTP